MELDTLEKPQDLAFNMSALFHSHCQLQPGPLEFESEDTQVPYFSRAPPLARLPLTQFKCSEQSQPYKPGLTGIRVSGP